MVSRRRIWVRRSLALFVVAVLAGVAAGSAIALLGSDPPAEHADGAISQRGLTGNGWPWLAGTVSEPGAKGRAWQRCAPECGEVVSTAEYFTPGKSAAGTKFRLSAPDGETVWDDTSPAWNGQVENTALPTLDGTPTVGKTITPHRGKWTGGWPDDGSTVGVRACKTVQGEGCVALSASLINGAGRRASVEVGPVYAGWYVGAIEQRVPGVQVVTTEKKVPPGGTVVSRFPAPTPGQIVAAGRLVGPVKAAAAEVSATTPVG